MHGVPRGAFGVTLFMVHFFFVQILGFVRLGEVRLRIGHGGPFWFKSSIGQLTLPYSKLADICRLPASRAEEVCGATCIADMRIDRHRAHLPG
jgi:hypothetical protein